MRSAPTTDPATKLAFDALVAAICGLFKARKEHVPIQGFAALATRSQRATTTECTGAEKRALGALIGLAKDDDATWSLLQAFSVAGDKERFTTPFNSARMRATRHAKIAANLLKEQEKATKKAAAKSKTKRSTDDQPGRELKKAKLVAIDPPPRTLPAQPTQPTLPEQAETHTLPGQPEQALQVELRDLRAELRDLRNELRRSHEVQRVMTSGLFRLQASMTTLEGELQAVRRGQVFLAQHVTTERVATAAALQSARTAEEREPRVWLSHIRLTPEMHAGPLQPIPKGFRGSVFLYILDRFTNKPIPHDPFGIFPHPVPAGTWLDAWCARAYEGIQWCVPAASFVTNAATAFGLVSEGATSQAQAAVATLETVGSWLAPSPSAQDAQDGSLCGSRSSQSCRVGARYYFVVDSIVIV